MSNTRSCAHCISNQALPESPLCEPCSQLPRCEVCTVFFDGLVSASKENPNRCDGCLDFEELIKFQCASCHKPIPIYASKRSNVLNYIHRGNDCAACNANARAESKVSDKDEEHPQFIGYLAIIEKLHAGGAVDDEEWERAIKMNRHDVTHWRGIEELQEEEDYQEVDLMTI